MALTFKQLQLGPVGRAAGYDIGGCDFLQICRDAVRQAMNRGEWFSTVVPLDACVRDGTVTWPRGTSTILGINYNGQQQAVTNMWAQYMQPDSWHREWANEYRRRGWFGNTEVETRGTACCFNPIRAEGFVLRTFITQPTDAGKKITFYGTDVNGQPIFSTRSDGTIQPGVQVTMANPSVDTPMAIRHVTRVVKEETDGDVLVYQYNLAGGFMLDFGRYQPTECTPEYITTVLRGGCGNWSNHISPANPCIRCISSLIKVEFVPFKFDDDLVQIDSEDAIRDMVLSIRKKDQGDISGSEAYEISAIRELNYQMRRRFPDEQFIVNFRPFGNDDLNNGNVRISQM
jgi:hypothetical protein